MQVNVVPHVQTYQRLYIRVRVVLFYGILRELYVARCTTVYGPSSKTCVFTLGFRVLLYYFVESCQPEKRSHSLV